jgi:hypothetical protein
MSFSLNGVPHCLTFVDFCGCFGHSTTGELEITEDVVQEVAEAWQCISMHTNLNYLRKKSATFQNPTIRYFSTFLANSIFGKGDTGAMANPKMSVICSALYPDMQYRMNLGALHAAHSALPPTDVRKLRRYPLWWVSYPNFLRSSSHDASGQSDHGR